MYKGFCWKTFGSGILLAVKHCKCCVCVCVATVVCAGASVSAAAANELADGGKEIKMNQENENRRKRGNIYSRPVA